MRYKKDLEAHASQALQLSRVTPHGRVYSLNVSLFTFDVSRLDLERAMGFEPTTTSLGS